MKSIIHINQHVIKRNKKKGENNPAITVKTYKSNRYTSKAIIHCKCGEIAAEVVYSPEKPLACGARAFITTNNRVEVEE